jgi:hypothetical protein
MSEGLLQEIGLELLHAPKAVFGSCLQEIGVEPLALSLGKFSVAATGLWAVCPGRARNVPRLRGGN